MTYTCDLRQLKLWNYYSLGFIIFSIWVLERMGIETFLEESILNGSKILVLITFVIIIINNHGLTPKPYDNIFIFMLGSGFAMTVLLIELIKTYGKKWIIMGAVLLVAYVCLLLDVAEYLILKQQ